MAILVWQCKQMQFSNTCNIQENSSVIIKCSFVLPNIMLSTKRILLFNRLRRTRSFRLQKEHFNKDVILLLFRLKTFNALKFLNKDSTISVISLWSSIIWIRCGKHAKLCLCDLLILLKLISKTFILSHASTGWHGKGCNKPLCVKISINAFAIMYISVCSTLVPVILMNKK